MTKKQWGSLPNVPVLVLVLTVFVTLSATADTIQDLHLEGQRALAAGQYYAAIEAYSAALRLNPSDLQSYIGTAEAYYWLGEYDQADVHASRARELSRLNARVLTLSGRIAIGLGDVGAAESYFNSAKSVEPNNVGADIGLAELALAEGRSLDAALSLERALTIHPENRKALLSLVLIYEQVGDIELAEDYLELALETHGNVPETQILAAEFDLRRGQLDTAASHARTAQALDVHNRAAARIRATTALLDGRYSEAIATAEEMLRTERTDEVAWFIRGQALTRVGRTDDAMDSFRTALRYNPDNEIIRLVAESLAINDYGMEAPVRSELARYTADRAARYERTFQYSKAISAYQQALRLTPFDSALRLSYANLHRVLGHRATYLQELHVIRDAGLGNEDLDRRISVFENALSESVASRWNIDQFTLQKSTTSVALFLTSDSGPMTYPFAEWALLEHIVRNLDGLERIKVSYAGRAAGFRDAFAEARSQDVDFFITLGLEDTARTVALDATVHVGRTGVAVQSFALTRVGPERVSDVAGAFVRRMDRLFPLTSTVVARRGTRVVIDAGARDGLSADSELIVLAPGAVMIDAGGVGLSYDKSSVLGTLVITVADDLISEAELVIDGLVDAVVVGDIAVIPGETVAERPAATMYPLLYDRVRSLR